MNDWIELYSNDLEAKATFQLFNTEEGQYIIEVDKGLDNDRFFYLVNYMKYPINIEYQIEVIGYTKGDKKSKLKNKALQVYISDSETNSDNVYVTTHENENYKIDFGGKTTLVHNNLKFEKKPISKLTKSVTFNNSKNKTKGIKKAKSKTNKRFKLISLAIAISYILLLALLYANWETKFFVKSLWFLNLGVAIWLFIDYEILRDNLKFLSALILATLIIPYTLLVIDQFGIHSFHTSISSSLHAVVLLITQWPLRRIFLKTFKVEPEVDRTGNFKDMIYTFILGMSMMVIPFIIEDMINK